MAVVGKIPVSVLQELIGKDWEAKPEKDVDGFLANAVIGCFNYTTDLFTAINGNCRLVFLDVSEVPFKDLGDVFTLTGMTPKDAVKITAGERSKELKLDLEGEALQTLENQLGHYGLSAAEKDRAVAGMLRLGIALERYQSEHASPTLKLVIRGLSEHVEAVLQKIDWRGRGAVIDRPETVKMKEVHAGEKTADGLCPIFIAVRPPAGSGHGCADKGCGCTDEGCSDKGCTDEGCSDKGCC
ncbi:MAG: hypothetical protein ABIJ96_09165 [Elusimicrobiota bacterium]